GLARQRLHQLVLGDEAPLFQDLAERATDVARSEVPRDVDACGCGNVDRSRRGRWWGGVGGPRGKNTARRGGGGGSPPRGAVAGGGRVDHGGRVVVVARGRRRGVGCGPRVLLAASESLAPTVLGRGLAHRDLAGRRGLGLAGERHAPVFVLDLLHVDRIEQLV